MLFKSIARLRSRAKRYYIYMLSCAALLAIPFSGYAQKNAQSFSLESCVQIALKNNLDVQNAALNMQATEANRKSFLSNLYPTVDLTGSYQYFLELPTTLIPASFLGTGSTDFIATQFGTSQDMIGALGANFSIFNYTTFIGLKGLRYQKDAASYKMIKTKENIAYNVSSTFYTIQIVDLSLRLVEDNIASLRTTIDANNALKEQHLIAEEDVSKLVLQLKKLETEYISNKNQRNQLYNLLKYLMNLPLEDSIEIVRESEENLSKFYDRLPATPVDNLMDIKLQQTQINLLKVDRQVALGRFLPSLDIMFNYQFTGYNTFFAPFEAINRWYPSSFVGVRLKIPVFQGFNNWHTQRQKKFEIMQEQHKLDMMKKDMQRQIINAYNDYQTQKEIAESNRASLDISMRIHRADKAKYESGLIPITTFLRSQDDLNLARHNYISGIVQLKKIELDYRKLLQDLI